MVKNRFSELKNVKDIDPTKMAQWKDIGISVGRTDIVTELKSAYHLSSLELIADLKKFSQELDRANLAKTLHKMKSGCGNVGLCRLQMMCECGELYLKESTDISDEDYLYIFSSIDLEFQKSLILLESL